MSKLKIAQLTKYCEDEAVNKKIYPVTLLQSVYDACTGVRLDSLLATINSIYLPYRGSFKETMLTIPAKQRRPGLIVTFKDYSNVINTVRYKTDNFTIADEQWGTRSNWEGWTFDSVIEDLAAALDVIFKDLASYPEFSEVLHRTLTEKVESYLDEPDNKTAMADLLKDSVEAVAKETTLEVWREACNYTDIVSILYGGTKEAVEAIFADISNREELINIIRTQTQAAIADEVLKSVSSIFDNIHNHEDTYNHIVSVIDNKIHDIFYNILDYKDLSDIVRECINAKLADLTADEEILAVINGYVKTWLEAMLTDGKTYPEVAKAINTQICKHTNFVFDHISKYPEILGAIDNGVYEKLKYIISNSEDNAAIQAIIDGFVGGYVLEIFRGIACQTPLHELIVIEVKNAVDNIFNNLEDNPDLKLQFDYVVTEAIKNIINNINNYPELKQFIEDTSRKTRHNIIVGTADLTYKYSELSTLNNIVLSDVDIEYTYPNPIKEDDSVILEFPITDDRFGTSIVKAVLIGHAIRVNVRPPVGRGDVHTATIDLAVINVIYTNLDERIDNIITAAGLNDDGSFKMFREPEIDRSTNYRDITLSLLVTIRKVAKATLNLEKALNDYIKEANDKFVHSDTLGKPNGIPVLDENGIIKKEFIHSDYDQVFIGRFIDEQKFTNRRGVTLAAKDNALYVDITTNYEYRYDEKYVRVNEQVQIGEGYGEAFEGFRGKQLERIAISLPKNIVSDVKDAVRFADMMQIKYRGKTKTDLQTYTDAFDRAITLHPVTEELAGIMLPNDKWTINHIEEVVLKIIKDNAEKVLELITPEGYEFVIVKKEDTHKEIVPEGFHAVYVNTDDEVKIYEDPNKNLRAATYVNPGAIYDDPDITEKDTIVIVPDGYSAVVVKQTI